MQLSIALGENQSVHTKDIPSASIKSLPAKRTTESPVLAHAVRAIADKAQGKR